MLLILLLLPLLSCWAATLDPPAEDVAARAVPTVINAMHQSNWLHYRNYGSWSYEGGAITRGLWEISNTFTDRNLEEFLHQHLNYFIVWISHSP